MTRPERKLRGGLLVLLIIVGLSTRFLFLIPGFEGISNFTAIGALCLFCSAYFGRREAIMLMLGLMMFSDLLLNNVVYSAYYDSFQWFGNVWVYFALGYVVLIGRWFLKWITVRNVVISAILGALAFFLITNFESWIRLPQYSKDLVGLGESLAAGVPFFRNTLISNLVYSALLFGVFEFSSIRASFLSVRPRFLDGLR